MCLESAMTGFLFIPFHAESLSSVDSYLTGLVLMTGIYAHTQIQPFPYVPDIGQLTVEVGNVSVENRGSRPKWLVEFLTAD